jgi:hypothetical protein
MDSKQRKSGTEVKERPAVCADKEHAASCKEHAVLFRMIFTPSFFPIHKSIFFNVTP